MSSTIFIARDAVAWPFSAVRHTRDIDSVDKLIIINLFFSMQFVAPSCCFFFLCAKYYSEISHALSLYKHEKWPELWLYFLSLMRVLTQCNEIFWPRSSLNLAKDPSATSHPQSGMICLLIQGSPPLLIPLSAVSRHSRQSSSHSLPVLPTYSDCRRLRFRLTADFVRLTNYYIIIIIIIIISGIRGRSKKLI